MTWSFFRRSRADASHEWWRRAAVVAAEPSPEAIADLRSSMVRPDLAPDEADRQGELLEGLDRLVELRATSGLPDIPTQHRVIGPDRCHFIAPASLIGPSAVAGKLFLTSNRAIFAGTTVVSWPWHRVHLVVRADRDVIFTILGATDLFAMRCNTYSDALEAKFLSETLAKAGARVGVAP